MSVENFWIEDVFSNFKLHLEGEVKSNFVKNPKNFLKYNLAELSYKDFYNDSNPTIDCAEFY